MNQILPFCPQVDDTNEAASFTGVRPPGAKAAKRNLPRKIQNVKNKTRTFKAAMMSIEP
jgi:hypothetical protein